MSQAYVYTDSKGRVWHLNQKDVVLKNGRESTIYFFSKDERPTGVALPTGWKVIETKNSGMPVLKRG